MTDLISRQALLKELPHALWGKEWDEALAKAIIESMPTIDPVKHGKWINEETCSVCGESVLYDTDLCNYCPNCGAKMDEEKEDEE